MIPTSRRALAPNWCCIPRPDLPLDTKALARALIGWRLVRHSSDGAAGGRIVETEAYPMGDLASHAYRGETPRNSVMFGPPYHAYVYHIYGRYWCFNVTSEEDGRGAGILIRALEPETGIPLMQKRRGVEGGRLLCSGPARLAIALAIDRKLNGADLLHDPRIRLLAPDRPPGKIGRSRRIGLNVAASRLLRFYERGNPYVSGPKRLSP